MFAKNMINPVWFIGEVVDKNDPTNSGRVRVKAFNIHTNLNVDQFSGPSAIEKQDLPWAFVVNGTYGKMHCVPDEGEWILGFFADGRDCQHPFVVGSLYGSNTNDFGLGEPSDDDKITVPDKLPQIRPI